MGSKAGISEREIEFNAAISRRVEKLCDSRKVMRSELARAAGVSPSMLYNYEVGLSRWPIFRVRLIAEYLQVPIDRLIPKTQTCVESPAAQEDLL